MVVLMHSLVSSMPKTLTSKQDVYAMLPATVDKVNLELACASIDGLEKLIPKLKQLQSLQRFISIGTIIFYDFID